MMGYGYENAAGDRISALIDMINGGGPGRSGGTFEGGGILSLLANAVAKPYGSVRERPGHTPMGAAAAPMDVLRPVATEAVETMDLPPMDERASLPGLAESAEEGYRGAIFRPGSRRFMEEDFAVLGRLHPDVRALFSETKVGDPLSPEQAMFLNAAHADSALAPSAGPMQGPPISAAGPYQPQAFPEPEGRPTRPLVTPAPTGRVRDATVTPPLPPVYPRRFPDTVFESPPISVPSALESSPSLGFTAEEFRNLSPAMRNAALLQFTEDLGQMRP